MILLVDIGNTAIKWARLVNDQLKSGEGFMYSAADIESSFDSIWGQIESPERVVVSSVAADKVNKSLDDWAREKWSVDVEYIHAQSSVLGVRNAYSEPSKLGSDRWAALIAGHHGWQGSVCIVDCGSALTIDALADNGEHLGGLIIPGLATMRSSLMDNTCIEYSSEDEEVTEVSLLARDTHNAVKGGSLYAVVAVIDRVINDLSTELGAGVVRVITGGDALYVLPLLSGEFQHEPDLVLKGLALLANCEQRESRE